MFYQIFHSPQMKSCAIITYELVPSACTKMKTSLILAKTPEKWKLRISHSALFDMKTRFS